MPAGLDFRSWSIGSRPRLPSFTTRLLQQGIDTRPIVSGNMALQPAVRHFNVDLSMGPFIGAQAIHDRGLFIGCHAETAGG